MPFWKKQPDSAPLASKPVAPPPPANLGSWQSDPAGRFDARFIAADRSLTERVRWKGNDKFADPVPRGANPSRADEYRAHAARVLSERPPERWEPSIQTMKEANAYREQKMSCGLSIFARLDLEIDHLLALLDAVGKEMSAYGRAQLESFNAHQHYKVFFSHWDEQPLESGQWIMFSTSILWEISPHFRQLDQVDQTIFEAVQRFLARNNLTGGDYPLTIA
jgi:hypothetical protein